MKKFLLLGALTIWGLKRSRSIEDKSRTVNKSTTKIARQNLVFWIAGSAIAAVTLTIVGVMVYWDRKKKLKASFDSAEERIIEALKKVLREGRWKGEGRLKIDRSWEKGIIIKCNRAVREMLLNYDATLVTEEIEGEFSGIFYNGDIHFLKVQEGEFFSLLQGSLRDDFKRYLFMYSEMDPDFKGEWTQEQFKHYKDLNMKNSGLSEEAKRKITKKFDTLILEVLARSIDSDAKTLYDNYKKAYG